MFLEEDMNAMASDDAATTATPAEETEAMGEEAHTEEAPATEESAM